MRNHDNDARLLFDPNVPKTMRIEGRADGLTIREEGGKIVGHSGAMCDVCALPIMPDTAITLTAQHDFMTPSGSNIQAHHPDCRP